MIDNNATDNDVSIIATYMNFKKHRSTGCSANDSYAMILAFIEGTK
jgi:hypothetical protein